MVIVIMNKKFFKYLGLILIPLFLILSLVYVFRLYEARFSYYLIAKFSESGPLSEDMPVYYKGYNIGHTTKISPSKDYKYTFAKIVFYPDDPKLPEYLTAKVKKITPEKNYIELLNQDPSTTTLLKSGSTIDGVAAFDLEAFLSDIADAGIIVPLLQTLSDTSDSLHKTSDEIGSLASDSRSIIKDNRQNIKQTTKDLSSASTSLTKLTSRVNSSITEDKLNNTTSSIDKSSANILSATESIKNITQRMDCSTQNIDQTMANIDSTICKTDKIASNVRVITCGLRETLGKRFAGLRLIFGKPINGCKGPKNCP